MSETPLSTPLPEGDDKVNDPDDVEKTTEADLDDAKDQDDDDA